MEDGESQLAQDIREIRPWWRRWNVVCQANNIQWPEIVIFETLPETRKTDGLTIVHVSLGGIITKKPVNHDVFLALTKPAVLATKNAGGLARASGHEEPGGDTDEGGEDSFNEEAA